MAAGHNLQPAGSLIFSLLLHLPAGQPLHELLLSLTYVPAVQLEQFDPDVGLYMPASHGEHERLPNSPEISFPAEHSLQKV